MSEVKMNLSDLIQFQQNGPRLNDIQAHRNSIVPFVGAGVSKGCGLYLWGELLDIIAQDYFTSGEIKAFHQSADYLKYADSIVEASGNVHIVMRRIREIFKSTPYRLTRAILKSRDRCIISTK